MLHILSAVFATTAVSGQTVPLHAVDCENAPIIHNMDVQQLCQNDFVHGGESITLTVAQIVQKTIHDGLRCTMHTSKFDVVCGLFSHEKFITIPQISKADPLKAELCQYLYTNSYAHVDGIGIPITIGTEKQFTYVRAGSMSHSNDNAKCIGGTVQIDGLNVTSIVEMVNRNLVTERIKFEVSLDEKLVLDLTNGDKLQPDVLHPTRNFNVNPYSYYVDYKKPRCNAVKVDTLTFELVKYKGVQWYLNEARKLAFKSSGTLNICNMTTIATQYANIVLLNETESKLENLNGILVDIDEEERIASDFIRFIEAKNLAQFATQNCLEIQANAKMLPSPFHPFSFLKFRNDVVSEIICKQVIVHAILGETRREFCTNSLPVFYNGKETEMQSNTRLIINPIGNSSLIKSPCIEDTLPIFASIDRKVMLIAKPTVMRYNISLENGVHSMDEMDLNNLTGNDLMFTHAQIKEWQNFLSFSHVRENTVNLLVHTLCQDQDCGKYTPLNTEIQFPTHLLSPMNVISRWMRNELIYIVSQVGNIAALFIGVYCIINWIMKAVHVCSLRSQKVPYKHAIKHVMFPSFPHKENAAQTLQTNNPTQEIIPNTLVTYIPRIYR